ncbi:phage holin, partial [Escherichia coli]|uniref:phage holin n=1 Tax=Escherichia coli TaxID=562 RepID=UPI000B73255A
MYQMEKITTGVSYTTSAVGKCSWFMWLLDRVSPSTLVPIRVLGRLLVGLRTDRANLYLQDTEKP